MRSDVDDGQVCQLYREGATIRALAERFSMSYTGIHYRLLRCHIPMRPQARRVAAGRDEAIIDDYRNGDSQVIIGKRYGTSQRNVSRVLAKHGEPTRGIGGRAAGANATSATRARTAWVYSAGVATSGVAGGGTTASAQ